MNQLLRPRVSALFEVVGVYLTGAALNEWIADRLVSWHLISPESPFSLLTAHTTNAELVIASRQLFLALILIYLSFALLILPIEWWRKRRGRAMYGLTRAGYSWKSLAVIGIATASLVEWPVLIHSLVDVVHPLGPMAPWRQAFFDMSWRRWQFWLFAGILSYALIPVLEELLFRGYYQRRLAEAWGDGPAVVAVACLFTFSHKQYLIANTYNLTMVASLFVMAVGLGAVFAWTRSLYPSMLAHAVINIPMTPRWQLALLIVFLLIIFYAWRGGKVVFQELFAKGRPGVAVLLGIGLAMVGIGLVLYADRIPALTWIAIGFLVTALALDAVNQKRRRATGRDS